MTSTPLAIVTGATGGIGTAICRALGRSGYALVAHGRGDKDRARVLEQTLSRENIAHHIISADLSTDSGVEALTRGIDEVVTTHADYRFAALVNNAARLLGPSLDSATSEQFDAYFHLNVKAPFFLTQYAAEKMPPGGGIVNISSASAHISSPGDIVYAMTKASLESLTSNAAEAIANRGLRVNTVVPGFTDNGHAAFRDPNLRRYMSSFSVLGDVAQPDDVAEAVLFLLSDRSSRTTGATLDVSGGTTLRPRGESAHSIRHLIEQGD